MIATNETVRLLTTRQAADQLGLSVPTVKRLTVTGELESVTIGRSRRYPSDAVARFIASLRVDTPPAA